MILRIQIIVMHTSVGQTVHVERARVRVLVMLIVMLILRFSVQAVVLTLCIIPMVLLQVILVIRKLRLLVKQIPYVVVFKTGAVTLCAILKMIFFYVLYLYGALQAASGAFQAPAVSMKNAMMIYLSNTTTNM